MIEVNKEFWKEIRCPKCRSLLANEYIFNGRILIKCYKCNEMVKIAYKTPKNQLERIMLEDEATYNPDEEIIIKRKINLSDLKGGENE